MRRFRQKQRFQKRSLSVEPLEDRRLLATVMVTTANDIVDYPSGGGIAALPGPDGLVSLREAILATNSTAGADEIIFDVAGVFATPQTLLMTQGEYVISDDIVISGPGASQLTIDAQESTRLFRSLGAGAASPREVEIAGVTITSTSESSGRAINELFSPVDSC